MTGDFAAIEIFSYKDFKQVGEFVGRLGMMYKLSDILKEIILEIYKRSSGRIIICIENNFEKSIIENLILDETFNFEPFIYKESDKEVFGINTNTRTRDIIISEAFELISDKPENICSKELVSEISSLERRVTGKIEAARGFHDDCFMASAMCAYVRRKTLLTYMPLIDFSIEEVEQKEVDFITKVVRDNLLFDDARVRRDTDYSFFESEDELDNPDGFSNDEYSPFIIM